MQSTTLNKILLFSLSFLEAWNNISRYWRAAVKSINISKTQAWSEEIYFFSPESILIEVTAFSATVILDAKLLKLITIKRYLPQSVISQKNQLDIWLSVLFQERAKIQMIMLLLLFSCYFGFKLTEFLLGIHLFILWRMMQLTFNSMIK